MRLISMLTRVFNSLWNRALFAYKKVDCAEPGLIRGRLEIRGRGQVQIATGVRINSGPAYNPIGGDRRACLTLRGGKITIGENVGMSNCTLVSDSEITIGRMTKLGGSVKIYDTDFHSLDPSERAAEVSGKRYGASRAVALDENVFVGAHTIILKGVRIGRNSVIGAGSVVTRSVPENEIWAGNPARFIRKTPGAAVAPHEQ